MLKNQQQELLPSLMPGSNQYVPLHEYIYAGRRADYTYDAQMISDGAFFPVDVSVVIPMLNEEESLEQLYEQLQQSLATLGRTFEVILIDDGSTDRSFTILKQIHERDPRFKIIRFRRNFGQTAAFSAGFDLASGYVVITMDADLQNDPNDIPKLLEKIDEGYDVVSGWRFRRQDALLHRKLPSQIANGIISHVTGVRLHDYGCSLKAYRSTVVKNLHLYGEMHRFIPALAKWMGIQVAEVPVNHRARQFGRSKYGLSRTIKVILDLITVKFLLDYATRPIQIFGLLGMACFGGGTLLTGYLGFTRLVFSEPLSSRPILWLGILLLVLGVQLITMGLLGELIVRTYYETQRKPIYMVRDVLSGPSVAPASELSERVVGN